MVLRYGVNLDLIGPRQDSANGKKDFEKTRRLVKKKLRQKILPCVKCKTMATTGE